MQGHDLKVSRAWLVAWLVACLNMTLKVCCSAPKEAKVGMHMCVSGQGPRTASLIDDARPLQLPSSTSVDNVLEKKAPNARCDYFGDNFKSCCLKATR